MLNRDLRNFLNNSGDLVVLVSDEYPPETGFGGIGSYTFNMSRGLVDQGCRVVVISRGLVASSVAIDDGVAVIRFDYVSLWQRGLLKISRQLRLERTVRTLLFAWCVFWQIWQIKKLSYVMAIEAPEWGAPLIFVGWLTRWRYAIRIHTPLAKVAELDHLQLTLDMRFCLWMEAQVVAMAKVVFYASELSLRDSRRFWSLDDQRLVLSPLPIDTGLFASRRRPRADRPTIVFVGRLEAKKGVDMLIQALPIVFRKVKTGRCVIVGPDGRDVTGGSMKARLESMVAALGLAGAVEFVEATPYVELPLVLQYSWVLANPSQFESFGMTSLEAVACGARTVVAPGVGFEQWLQPSMGQVMEVRTTEALAEALVSCLMTKPRVDMDYVEQTFGLEAVAKQVIEIYSHNLKVSLVNSE